jgi:hypothetical protein
VPPCNLVAATSQLPSPIVTPRFVRKETHFGLFLGWIVQLASSIMGPGPVAHSRTTRIGFAPNDFLFEAPEAVEPLAQKDRGSSFTPSGDSVFFPEMGRIPEQEGLGHKVFATHRNRCS